MQCEVSCADSDGRRLDDDVTWRSGDAAQAHDARQTLAAYLAQSPALAARRDALLQAPGAAAPFTVDELKELDDLLLFRQPTLA